MDARQVRYFLAVVDHAGVTRAANALYVAQPSLSQAIKSLEKQLGTSLFERAGRGVKLTPTGEAFVEPARKAHQALMDAAAHVRRINRLEGGHLDIATPASLVVEPLADLIARFRSIHPKIVVNIMAATTSEASVDMVRRAQCDIGLVFLPCDGQDTDVLTIDRHRPVRLGVASDWPTALPSVIPLELLASIPLVTGPHGDGIRDMVDRECRKLGLVPNVVVEAGSYSTVRELVLKGAGAALLPSPIAEALSRSGGRIHPCKPELFQQYGLVSRRDFISPASAAFVDLLMRGRSRCPAEDLPDQDAGPTAP